MADQIVDPEASDEEDPSAPDPEEEKRRRRIHVAFLLLEDDTKAHLHQLAHSLEVTSGHAIATWFKEVFDSLLAAHTEAWVLGRRLAKKVGPANEEDTAMARSVMRDEKPYLDGFEADLKDGDKRYINDDGSVNVDAVASRLDDYVDRLYGTATESAHLATIADNPEDMSVDWHLNDGSKHCSDCPRIAKGGPYTAATLPTTPGAGDTRCKNWCRCWLEYGNGFVGFTFGLE